VCCVAPKSQANLMSDVKLHAECKWDCRRPLNGTEIRLFFDEWRAISSARADEPRGRRSATLQCAAGRMLMALLMEADGDLKMLISFGTRV
jgi:hypothetical protein